MKVKGLATVDEDGNVSWSLIHCVEERGLQFKDNEESLNLGTGVSWSITYWESNSGSDVTRLEKQDARV